MKKIDFHIHTVQSISDENFTFDINSLKEYVDMLEIDCIAITNHNLFDKTQFEQICHELTIKVFPGIEIDLKFNDTWMEVLGAGMVHPNVLENVGIDSKKYSGFAFGVGIDRLTMMKYNIKDIRHFYQGGIKIHDALQDTKTNTETC